MSAALVSKLTDLLDQEAGTYDALLALAERKHAALTGGEALALEPIIEGEQALLWRLGRLRDARSQLARELGASLGLDSPEPSLAELGGAVDEGGRAAFERAEAALAGVLERLSRLNATNAALIQAALSYVEFSLNLLGQALPAGGGAYAPGPKAGRAASRRRLNRQL